MMARDRRDTCTPDLLSWQPRDLAVRYSEGQVRGASLYARFCRAIAMALKDCEESTGKNRATIAKEMAEYLHEPSLSEDMLNKYASEASTNHNINLVRFAALVHVTQDMRLLSLIPDLFGFVVIEEKYLSVIKSMQLREKQHELQRLADIEERKAREALR